MESHASHQDRASVEKNKAFFAENVAYAESVERLTTYRNIRRAVDTAISGCSRLLDVGNGGVFDYDTSLVAEIVGVDLFLDAIDTSGLPPNVKLEDGDALDLKQETRSFDAVLCVFLLHHLVASDVEGTFNNIDRAIEEARRVLRTDGKLIVVESCVSSRAFAVEKRLFGALRTLARTPLLRHPPTLQFPPEAIEAVLRRHFDQVSVEAIPVGKIILQFGHRWPTALTPARPYLFTVT